MAESAISTIHDGKLLYRGISIDTVVTQGTFAEVAFLLWRGYLPTEADLAELRAEWTVAAELPREVSARLRGLPPTTSMLDALREGVETFSLQETRREQGDGPGLKAAVRLVAAVPFMAAHFYHVVQGRPLFAPRTAGDLAARFLHAVRGEPPLPAEARALDQALILYADHELNASTFVARVVASTRADLYSAVVAALCALKGPLHGGATAEVWRFLERLAGPEAAAREVNALIAFRQRVPGFGHRVYRGPDPRAVIFRTLALDLVGNSDWIPTADAVAEAVHARLGLFPNSDFYSAVLMHALGFNLELTSAMFPLGRMAGWTAHVLEQYANNRLIRPRALYTGSLDGAWLPLSERSRPV